MSPGIYPEFMRISQGEEAFFRNTPMNRHSSAAIDSIPV
jgi:hypothetical protein